MFLLLLVIQALVGYVELGTDSWITKITGTILNNPNQGVLLFSYTSGLMFILRFFGGPIEHRLSPIGLLFTGSVLATIGLLLVSRAEGFLFCLIAVTVYGLGKTFFWPTMLAVASKRFPKGGAITLGALGGIGMLSAGLLGGPGIGFKLDYYTAEELRQKDINTYNRYEKENSFYGVIHGHAVDASKLSLLEKTERVDQLQRDLAKLDLTKKTDAAKEKTLNLDKELTQEEIDAALKNEKLATWWKRQGEPNQKEDRPALDAATLFGCRMTPELIAIVPATMAVLYLLLLAYFRLIGGYKKEVVLTTEAPASEF